MHRSPLVSIFCHAVGRSSVTLLTLLCLVAAPARSSAQTGDVSGVAPGPGNANGLNNTRLDPSGIGNAAKMPPLPEQHSAITPVQPPFASGSSRGAYQALPYRRPFVDTRRS